MFSQTAEYGLRAVVCLAQHSGRPLTTQHIAELTKVPAGYLSKVLQTLGRAELVTSQRGIRGGFVLAVPASELSLLRVVNALDPLRRIRHCPLHLEAHCSQLCPLHQRLDDSLANIERNFADTSIADMVVAPGAATPLCAATPSKADTPAEAAR